MVRLSLIQSYLFLFLEHNPGLVPVQVSCDGQVVSNTVIFVSIFRAQSWTGTSTSIL